MVRIEKKKKKRILGNDYLPPNQLQKPPVRAEKTFLQKENEQYLSSDDLFWFPELPESEDETLKNLPETKNPEPLPVPEVSESDSSNKESDPSDQNIEKVLENSPIRSKNSNVENDAEQLKFQEMSNNSLWNLTKDETIFDQIFNQSSTSIEACLYANSKPEILNGKNLISCEKCKSKQIASRITVLSSLPEILVLHLKRYKQNAIFGNTKGKKAIFGGSMSKDNTRISFNSLLEIKGTRYRLNSIVEHSGGLNSGHYTASVRLSDDSVYYCSDSSVRNIKDIRNVNPYMLFYEKIQ